PTGWEISLGKCVTGPCAQVGGSLVGVLDSSLRTKKSGGIPAFEADLGPHVVLHVGLPTA
ncbi:MAG: hypothetical protein AAGG79_07645, partial [Pseudomonadota bacterium]